MVKVSKEIIRFFALSLGFGIQGIVWSSIPLLFYRPATICKADDGVLPKSFECTEFQACKSQYNPIWYEGKQITFEKVSRYPQMHSISQEFDLFCNKKIVEANLLSFGILGQLFGGLLAFCYRIEKKYQQKAFISLLFAEFLLFFACNVATSVHQIGVIFFFWNFIACYYQCLLFTHINQTFEGQLQEYGPTITNIVWACTSIFFIIIAYFWGNWRISMGFFLSGVSLILSVILLLVQNKEKEQCPYQQQQGSVVTQVIQNINILKNNKKIRINCFLWGFNMMAGTVVQYVVALVLNTLVGDLYVNALMCTSLEIFAQVAAGYLIVKGYDLKKVLINIFYLIGISYSACVFVQDSSDAMGYDQMSSIQIFLKLLPIIVGKATHECLWTVLYTYMPKILPEEVHQFNTGMAQVFTISMCSLMPYYKFLMEYLNFNSFVCIGLLCFVTAKYNSLCVEYNKEEDIIDKGSKDIPLMDMA